MSNHHWHLRHLSRFAALGLLASVALAGCTDVEPLGPEDGSIPGPTLAERPMAERPMKEEKSMTLATLRRATAAYHNVEKALEDGFVSQKMCVAENPIDGRHPLGIPFVHLDRLLDGALDPEEPEILFYAPRENGTLRLVGVEMAVPIALWGEEDPPELFGRQLHENEAEGLYGLHIWIWLHNPEGTFAIGHPGISCEAGVP